jgi:hypothetical protein
MLREAGMEAVGPVRVIVMYQQRVFLLPVTLAAVAMTPASGQDVATIVLAERLADSGDLRIACHAGQKHDSFKATVDVAAACEKRRRARLSRGNVAALVRQRG